MCSLGWLITVGSVCFLVGFIFSSMLSTRGNRRKTDLKHIEVP